MLAHGFTVEQIVEVVSVLLATAHTSRGTIEVSRVRITRQGDVGGERLRPCLPGNGGCGVCFEVHFEAGPPRQAVAETID
jgi:hypothetical protein